MRQRRVSRMRIEPHIGAFTPRRMRRRRNRLPRKKFTGRYQRQGNRLLTRFRIPGAGLDTRRGCWIGWLSAVGDSGLL